MASKIVAQLPRQTTEVPHILPRAFPHTEPETEAELATAEAVCLKILCDLADVDFVGVQQPQMLLFQSRCTRSTYALPISEVAIHGAALIQKTARDKDRLFGCGGQ